MPQAKKTTTAYAKIVPDCPECGMKMILEHRRGDYTAHCGNPSCQNYCKRFIQPSVKVENSARGSGGENSLAALR